jgi:hypothetical protein
MGWVYKGKNIPSPMIKDDNKFYDHEEMTKPVRVVNRFRPEEADLPYFAMLLYRLCLRYESDKNWDDMRKIIAWFKEYFPKQYLILLD